MKTCIVEAVEVMCYPMNTFIDPSFVEVNEARFNEILGAVNFRRQRSFANAQNYEDVQQRVFATTNFTRPGVRYLVDPAYCEVNQ